MTKELILKEFLKLQKETGVMKEYTITTYEELLNALSEEFAEEYDGSPDAQDAYDNLNDYLDNFLEDHAGMYSLGTKDWSIECYSNASKEIIESAINQWNQSYLSNIKDIDDLTSAITHDIMDTMSNVGCDVHNAFAIICEETFEEKHPLFIDLGEPNPRIDFDI